VDTLLEQVGAITDESTLKAIEYQLDEFIEF